MIRTIIPFFVVSAAVAFAAVSQTANQPRTDMQNPKAKLSGDVTELLTSTSLARKAIARHEQQQAANDIQQALTASSDIASRRSGGFVPLYTELERMSVLWPILRQAGSGTNGTSVTNGQTRAVGVHEVVGDYTSVALDDTAARAHLQAAQQALNKNDWKTADQDLQAVEGSVIVESVAADMPLLRARENMVLARDSAKAGHYRQAQAQLRAASRALASYEQTSISHRQQAEQLKSEIDSYAQSMSTNHSDAPSRIESWWNQTTDWVTPANANHALSAKSSAPTRP